MTVEMLKAVIAAGDRYGSALKELTARVGTINLEEITDEEAKEFLDGKQNTTEDQSILNG